MGPAISRYLPNNEYEAAINANAPSAINPFATIADLALASNIYTADGALISNRTLSGAFDLTFANTGAFKRTGNLTFSQGAHRTIEVEETTGFAGYKLIIKAGNGKTGTLGSGGGIEIRPGAGGSVGGSAGAISLSGQDVVVGNGIGSDIYFISGHSANNRGGHIFAYTGNGGGIQTGGNFTISTGTGTARGKILFQNGSEGTVGHIWTSTGVAGEGSWAAPVAVNTLYTADGTIASATRNVTVNTHLYFLHGAAGINGSIQMSSGGYFKNTTAIATNYFEYDHNSGTFLTNSTTHTRTGFKTSRSGTFIEMMSDGTRGYFNTNSYIEFYVNNTGTYCGMIDSSGRWRLGGNNTGAKVSITGSGSTSATINQFWYNSVSGELARMNDAGQFFVGTTTNNGSQITSGGDIEVIGDVKGLVLEDRTLGTRHRVYLDNGSLFFENA